MHSCIWTIMLPGRWDTCQKEVNHEDDIPTGKLHRFQKLPQPNPNYMSEKWKLSLSKITQVHSVLFISVLSILCSNTYWLSPSCYGIWRTLSSRVDIKQSGSWVVLRCICWTCVADFSSRYVIFMIQFFFFDMYLINQAAYLFMCSSVWNFKMLPGLLTYICTIVLGVLCTFSDNLGGTGLHNHKCPIPWSKEGNHDLVFSLCSFDYNFSTTKFKFR